MDEMFEGYRVERLNYEQDKAYYRLHGRSEYTLVRTSIEHVYLVLTLQARSRSGVNVGKFKGYQYLTDRNGKLEFFR